MTPKTMQHGSLYCICRAELQHLSALNAVELAAAMIFPPGSIPDHILADRVPLNVLLTAQQENMLWVAVDANDLPVGYLLLQVVHGLPLLAQLDVHPLHGRKGLGTSLIAHAIMQMQEMGFADIYLTTFSHVQWNAPFYKKLGFRIVDEQKLPETMVKILHEERMRGLSNRVAMRLSSLSDYTFPALDAFPVIASKALHSFSGSTWDESGATSGRVRNSMP